jgi:hypothetical protein
MTPGRLAPVSPHPAPVFGLLTASAQRPPGASQEGEVQDDDGAGRAQPVLQRRVIRSKVAVRDPAAALGQLVLARSPPGRVHRGGAGLPEQRIELDGGTAGHVAELPCRGRLAGGVGILAGGACPGQAAQERMSGSRRPARGAFTSSSVRSPSWRPRSSHGHHSGGRAGRSGPAAQRPRPVLAPHRAGYPRADTASRGTAEPGRCMATSTRPTPLLRRPCGRLGQLLYTSIPATWLRCVPSQTGPRANESWVRLF